MSSNAESDQSSVFDMTTWPDRARNVVFGDPNENNEHEPGLLNHLLLVLIGIVVVLLVFKIIEVIISRFKSRTVGSPYLVPKTKDAQKDLVIEKQQAIIKKQAPHRKWLWFAGGIVLGGATYYGIQQVDK